MTCQLEWWKGVMGTRLGSRGSIWGVGVGSRGLWGVGVGLRGSWGVSVQLRGSGGVGVVGAAVTVARGVVTEEGVDEWWPGGTST